MIAVIGCGNPNRRDDGVGPAVIRLLKERRVPASSALFFDAGTDGMSVMFAARGCRKLIIVDASRIGVEPGAIHIVPGDELERAYSPGLNLHDFRWEDALHAGRQIFKESFPKEVTVFLIEAADLGFGLELSDAVLRAAAAVASRIEAMIAPSPDKAAS